MPLYEYQCLNCGKHQDAYRKISDRNDSPLCCGKATEKCITLPTVLPDLPGYESPVSGKWIEGRKARIEDLRRTGCRPYEEGERKDYERSKKDFEKSEDTRLKEVMTAAYDALPSEQRKIISG